MLWELLKIILLITKNEYLWDNANHENKSKLSIQYNIK